MEAVSVEATQAGDVRRPDAEAAAVAGMRARRWPAAPRSGCSPTATGEVALLHAAPAALPRGHRPAIIAEDDATTVVDPGWQAAVTGQRPPAADPGPAAARPHAIGTTSTR